ncbi:mycothiol system anti-sigma-R factor [Actinobaculum sp. 352]|uniref:mycothiol system anti-sigma-R factor n=1 Tax=Actinobaculum sp. 352 TaxID=2490946 RepID=UPI000F7D685D|nr:mycothiol system anti-sigma-R factor [Actinobaculum sp. 352]RTE49008.1 mycothiol system anti-sigma-R factor [Actinobaculum sp. 352]
MSDAMLNGDEFATRVETSVRADSGTGGCSCSEVADHIFELLDSQMPAEQAERLQRHADSCPHCSALAEAEAHVREIVRRSCSESAPATLRMRITSQIAVYRSATE